MATKQITATLTTTVRQVIIENEGSIYALVDFQVGDTPPSQAALIVDLNAKMYVLNMKRVYVISDATLAAVGGPGLLAAVIADVDAATEAGAFG